MATDANQRYQTAEGRKAIAANLGSPERDATERPQELIDAMALKPGMTVADIGTGVGYMLPYLSRAVGAVRPRGGGGYLRRFSERRQTARRRIRSSTM